MFIGTRIPWPNVELIGKLACCVLFKMWIERSLPTRILLCPPRLVVPCLCTATMPIGRDVALMPSWFSLSAFGFGPGKGAEVELESVTDTNILPWPPQRRGRWPWNTQQLSSNFTSVLPSHMLPLFLSADVEGFQLESWRYHRLVNFKGFCGSMFTWSTSQVLLSGLTQLTEPTSEHKKSLGRHFTFRKSRFAFWFSWPRTNNVFVPQMSQLSSYRVERPWTWNAVPSPMKLCEPVPPFPTDLCWPPLGGRRGWLF